MTHGSIELGAPMDGVVSELTTEVGSLLEQGQRVARVVQAGPRWIDVAVPPREAPGHGYRLREGEGLDGELLARGSVVATDGMRRDRIRVSEEGASELLPGAVVAVDVLHVRSGLIVPVDALAARGRERIVFVQTGEDRYEPRSVVVLALAGGRALLADGGVRGGEPVVTQGAMALLAELQGAGGLHESE